MKSAVISGGSSGIGAALAVELARRGYGRIALTARGIGRLQVVAGTLSGMGCEVRTIVFDVRDPAAVRRGIEPLIEEWGVPDLAVANAGTGLSTPTRVLDLVKAGEVMETNFNGMLNFLAPIVPKMADRGSGHVVGIASLAGLRGMPGGSVYSASKAAMQAWLEAARVELGHRGVTVTIVNPGFVSTPLVAENKVPMPFMVTPEKAANVIAKGIERKARVVEFPLPMSLIMRTLRALPDWLFDRVTAPYGRGKAKSEEEKADTSGS